MPDPAGDFQTQPSPVAVVKYFCAHPSQAPGKSGNRAPWSPQREHWLDPPWRVWLGQREEDLLGPPWPTQSGCPDCISFYALEGKKRHNLQGSAWSLQPWKGEQITPGRSIARGDLPPWGLSLSCLLDLLCWPRPQPMYHKPKVTAGDKGKICMKNRAGGRDLRAKSTEMHLKTQRIAWIHVSFLSHPMWCIDG